MKQLQKSDLIDGKIYKQLSYGYIFLYDDKSTEYNNNGIGIKLNSAIYFKRWSANGFIDTMVEATLEEKHWLETCIKADKFISYKEAMKTFKSDEIISVEKWCIDTTELSNEQLQKLSNYLNELNNSCIYKTDQFKHWSYIGSIKGCHFLSRFCSLNDLLSVYNYTLINFEQFEKYVLKGETITIKATVETKSKFIDNNTVETSEGSIFKVGDLVTPFENSSPNKGKKFKITGFRWNNAQTEICAITELHKPYGVGVDKLEIYLEPKKVVVIPDNNESLLDKAKRLYPSGVKVISVVFKNICIIDDIRYGLQNSAVENYIFGNDGKCTLYNPSTNHWAEIIEYPHGFKVGDKISHKNYSTNWEIEKIEGNVLFLKDQNSWHSTVLAKNAIKVDDFVLPEKWAIKLNLENVDIVGKWFNKNSVTNRCGDYNVLRSDHKSTIYNILHFPEFNYAGLFKHGDINGNVENGYTEITFEQFKKYVLNETV